MKYYFYSDGGKQKGPLAFEQLKDENIDKDTLVWFEGLADWKPANEINELDTFFQLDPPPIPNYDTKIKLGQKNIKKKNKNLVTDNSNSKPYLTGSQIKHEILFFTNAYKWIIVFYLIWSFVHILLLWNGFDEWGFWPFPIRIWNSEFSPSIAYSYGSIEFFVYLLLPLLVFVIYKLVGKDIIYYFKRKSHSINNKKEKVMSKSKSEKTSHIVSPTILLENYNRRSKKTSKQLKIFWYALLGILITSAILEQGFLLITGSEMFENPSNDFFVQLARLWILVFMFIFAYTGVKSSIFLNKQSSYKILLAVLWWIIGFLSIWLLTIPILIQNRLVKKKEIELGKKTE